MNMKPINISDHNHQECIHHGIDSLINFCISNRLQLTPLRKRVFEFLLEQHQAVGAYQILERLHDEKMGSQPPVAYRSLDFLVKNGFVHKLERLNAFIACTHIGEKHYPGFLICRVCNLVVESALDLSKDIVYQHANESGFNVEDSVVEVMGICKNCSCKID